MFLPQKIDQTGEEVEKASPICERQLGHGSEGLDPKKGVGARTYGYVILNLPAQLLPNYGGA